MTDWPQNSDAVNEVLDFAASEFMADGLCARSHRLDPGVFEIIGDFREAKRIAWSQDIDHNVFEDWITLVTRLRCPKEALLGRYENADEAQQKLDKIEQTLRSTLEPHFESRFDRELRKRIYPAYHELFDDYYALLADIIESRLLLDSPDSFFELMFEAFKGGRWPCGWRGKYPEGRMIVFHPAAKDDD